MILSFLYRTSHGDFIKGQANLPAVRMILRTLFDHLEESFSLKEVQFKMFCLPVNTSFPPVENVNKIPAFIFRTEPLHCQSSLIMLI